MQIPGKNATIGSSRHEGTILKTLVIRFSSVGDILLSTPLLRALRKRFPEAQIDFLVKEKYAEVLRGNPRVTRVIPYSEARFRDLCALRAMIVRERYDLVLDLHDSIRSRLLCAGVPHVRRYAKRRIARWLLIHVKWDFYRFFGGAPGVAERYLETVRHLDVRDDGEGLEVFPSPEESASAGSLTAALLPVPLVGVCPAARHATKIWPAERYTDAAVSLARSLRSGVVLFGGPEDRGLCERMAEDIGTRDPVIPVVVAAGRLSILGTAALMDRCTVILTNDTGLMHLAAARKRPVIAVFGSTTRQLGFFPVGTRSTVVEHATLPCRPCTHIGRRACPQRHFRCMLDIAPDRVVEAARQLVRSS